MKESIMKRACKSGIAEINIINIRDFTFDKHHITDERLYGGGSGMVLKPEPIFAAVEAVTSTCRPRIIVTSPQGRPFDQKIALELAKEEQLIIICGHYEGIDERVLQGLATDVLSMGDFILTGGELPAMAIADAVVRLLPGALGDETATDEESFGESLLEYPQYTRPSVFRGMEVPEVLVSGNHKEISQWRHDQALLRTWQNRPELLEKANLTRQDKTFLAKLDERKKAPFRLYVALLHYPVYNKKKQVVSTSLTNLDLHDIARASATFGVSGYYIVQPMEGQRQMMQELIDHWQQGFGAIYNPDRMQALSLVHLMPYLEDVLTHLKEENRQTLKIIATSACYEQGMEAISYREMRKVMEDTGGNYLLLLGTGWGLAKEIIRDADFCLRPIYGKGDYNHLSVRSAASIILDRLLGEKISRY